MNFSDKPYDIDSKDKFYFLPKYTEISNKIVDNLENKNGCYVLYGFKGVGKTSLLNYSLERFEKSKLKKPVIIRINTFDDEEDFYRQFIYKLRTELIYIRKTILDEKYYRDKYIELEFKIDNSLEDLNILIEEYDMDISKTFTEQDKDSIKSNVEENTSIKGEGKYSILNMIHKIARKKEQSSHREDIYSTEKKYNLSFNDKKNRILSLISKLYESFNISVIIYESDSIDNNILLDFMKRNKNVFSDYFMTFILETNIGDMLYLQNKCDFLLEDNFILVESLNFIEFLIINRYFGNYINNFIGITNDFFYSNLNIRETIHNTKSNQLNLIKYPGLDLLYFLYSTYYNDLNTINKEIVSRFYIEFIKLLNDVGHIEKDDYNDILKKYKDRHDFNDININLIFKDFKDIIFNDKLKLRSPSVLYFRVKSIILCKLN